MCETEFLKELQQLQEGLAGDFQQKMSQRSPDEQQERAELTRLYMHRANEFHQMFAPYIETCDELFRQAQKTVVRKEYCIGDFMVHRGCYCPDPVYDLVVSGPTRGKKLKQPKPSKAGFEYGFNEKNQLVTSIYMLENKPHQYEVITYEGAETFAVQYRLFADRVWPESATWCRYEDGRIAEMFYSLYYGTKYPDMPEFTEFTYRDGKIHEWRLVRVAHGLKTVFRDHVQFVHDEAGRVIGYWNRLDRGKVIETPESIYYLPKKKCRKL